MNEILTQEKSIYIQIKEMIESDILRDILLEEERVPSTNELAKLYAINPATAAKGVNLLVDEGILYKKRGIGMFVAEGAKEQIMKKKKEHFYDDYIKSLMAEARNLGITKQELIAMIEESAEVRFQPTVPGSAPLPGRSIAPVLRARQSRRAVPGCSARHPPASAKR